MVRIQQTLLDCSILLLLATVGVFANVEKTIFTAPPREVIPNDAAIDNLLLNSLHPDQLSLRTYLNASFPTDKILRGQGSWFLLEGLTPGRRYELRVCWLATQPTVFWMDTYDIAQAFENPDLITALSVYSYARRERLTEVETSDIVSSRYKPEASSAETSIMFLHVQAAAEYFSLNKTLMTTVPPVHVDLILDPYLVNVFPQSLVPTAGYIAVIAVLAWFGAGIIYQQMMNFIKDTGADEAAPETKKEI